MCNLTAANVLLIIWFMFVLGVIGFIGLRIISVRNSRLFKKDRSSRTTKRKNDQ